MSWRAAALLAAASVSASVLLASAPRFAQADDEGAKMGRALQQLLRANTADIRACVAAAHDPAGEALLDIVAGKDRKVLTARVLKSDPAVASAARCVAERAQKWSLAALDVGEGDQLVLPLIFRPDPKPEVKLVEVVKSLDLDGSLYAIYLVKGNGAIAVRGRNQKLGPQHGAVVGIAASLVCPDTCTAFVAKLPRDVDFLGVSVWSFNALPVYTLPGKNGTVQLGTDGTPSIPIAYDWLEVRAGAAIPVHTHDASIEVTYVVAGSGSMLLAGKPIAVEAGKFYEIPAGVPHALTATSAMTIVQLYLPRGPEQRFKP